jgi:DNA-binding response OmpR family regulator
LHNPVCKDRIRGEKKIGVLPVHETIAVVDDEADIRELVSLHLKNNHFAVRGFSDGSSFLKYIETSVPGLVVLDLMLPDVDGLEICKQLRRRENTRHIPVIMLTAKSEESDTVIGLELGADDYIKKPFSPRELVARVKTVLRRAGAFREGPARIEIGGVSIDAEKYEASVNGKKIDLTATEFRILQLLASRKGRVFPREQILDVLWGNEKVVTDRTVDVHIKHLRSKLGPASGLIKVVRGAGYKLEE